MVLAAVDIFEREFPDKFKKQGRECYWNTDCAHTQYLLSMGLSFIYQVDLADSYDSRHRLLFPHMRSRHWDFLHEGFRAANDPEDNTPLKEYVFDHEVREKKVSSPFCNDPDNGPLFAWVGSHLEFTCDDFIYSYDHDVMREWAYVMWDQERLLALDRDFEQKIELAYLEQDNLATALQTA